MKRHEPRACSGRFSRRRALVLAVAAALGATPPARADTVTWTGVGGGPCLAGAAAWSSAGPCWSIGTPPANGDDVVLAQNGVSSPSIYDIDRTLNSITLNSIIGGATAYTISNAGGFLLGLQSGGFITDNNTNSTGDAINTGLTLNGPATITLSAGAVGLSFGVNAITGTGPLTLLNNSTNDALQLNVANTYTGATIINGTGRVLAAVNGAIPTGSALTVNGSVLFQASSTIGSLAGGGNVFMNGNNTLTVGGDSTSTTFSGVYQDSGDAAALTKAGAGTLTLSGANTYTGGTTINAGTLLVNGSLGNASVTVANGATLGGSGAIAGAVSVQDGGIVSPGSSPGTLTLGSLALSSGSVLDYELGTPGVVGGGVNDLIVVTGNLVLDGTLNVTNVGAFGAGVYRLIDYGGTLTNNRLAFGTLPGGVSAADLAVQTRIGGQVNLVFSTPSADDPTPPPVPQVQFWTGASTVPTGRIDGGSGTWDATTTNWADADGTAHAAWGGRTAVFGAAAGTVAVEGSPGFETIQFMTSGYTLTPAPGAALTPAGAAVVRVDPGVTATVAVPFSGSGSIMKSDAGTLVLTGASTHTGGTTISGGTLQIGAGDTTGSVAGNITNNAVLAFNRSNAIAFGGIISGTGSLTQAGTGTLTLSGANTYTGGTTVSAGTLAGTTTSLQGSIVNNAALAFDQATNGTYAGSIAGTGSVAKSGAGTVTLTSANTYTGGTTINAGTLAIGAGGTSGSIVGDVANNAALVFNRSDGVTFGGVISGTGSLTKAGAGTLSLSGANTYSGATNVNSGTLSVNGSIDSAVTVNNGGTLGGAGTINNTVTVMDGGIFSPGNSIGTITVSGNVTFDPGSVFTVEVDAAGNADRTNVTGAPGTATVNGGAVDVQASAGTYQRNTTYTILNATGGVTGTFANVTSNLAFLDPALTYDPNNVLLTLTRNDLQLSAVANTTNQLAVSRYLDAVANAPGASGLILQLDGLSAEQARAAFTSIGGDGVSALSRVTMAETGRFLGLLSGRTATAGAGTGLAFSGVKLAAGAAAPGDVPAVYAQAGARAGTATRPAGERGFWMQAHGSRGNVDGDGNGTGFDWSGSGLAAGFDAEVQPGTVLGGAASYGRANVDLDSGGGSARIRSPRLAFYGSHTAGPWQFRGMSGYAAQDFDTRRFVTIGANTTVATATHRGDEWSAYGEAEYTVSMGGYQLKPLVGLRYINLKEDGYTETGSAANLTVAARTTESVVTNLGVRYVRPFNAGRSAFEARAIWSHEFGDTNSAVTGRLAAAPAGAAFTVAGVPVKRDALTLGAGVSNEVAKNFSLHADYNVELRGSGQTHHALVLGLRYAW